MKPQLTQAHTLGSAPVETRRCGNVDTEGGKCAWNTAGQYVHLNECEFTHGQRTRDQYPAFSMCCTCVCVKQDTRHLQCTRGLSGWAVLVSLYKTKGGETLQHTTEWMLVSPVFFLLFKLQKHSFTWKMKHFLPQKIKSITVAWLLFFKQLV